MNARIVRIMTYEDVVRKHTNKEERENRKGFRNARMKSLETNERSTKG